MKLVSNWRAVLTRAWSVRCIVLAALLSGLEVSMSLIGGIPGIPDGVFAGLSGAVACLAFIARITAQKGVSHD